MSDCKASNLFRPARPDDLPFILELLRSFYGKAGGIYDGIPFHGPSAILTIGDVMARGVCLVGPSSCAGAVIGLFPWNHKARIARVVFWYFKSARGLAILDALAAACKAAGATHINTASQFPKNTIGRFYLRNGFTACETQFKKQL